MLIYSNGISVVANTEKNEFSLNFLQTFPNVIEPLNLNNDTIEPENIVKNLKANIEVVAQIVLNYTTAVNLYNALEKMLYTNIDEEPNNA